MDRQKGGGKWTQEEEKIDRNRIKKVDRQKLEEKMQTGTITRQAIEGVQTEKKKRQDN